MLMLLKPWRNISQDLKAKDETWRNAFTSFINKSSAEGEAIVSGIGYLHDCELAAKNDQDIDKIQLTENTRVRHEDCEDELIPVEASTSNISEEALDAIIRCQVSTVEEIHGRLAIEIARHAKIFRNNDGRTWATSDLQRRPGNAYWG